MQTLAAASLWHKTLFSELGSVAHSGSGGAKGRAALRRAQSLIEIFFALHSEMALDRLVEVGANQAETSRRFVSTNPAARAYAYEPSPAVYNQVVGGTGIPTNLKMINKAIGTKSGTVTFYAPNDPHFSVWGSTSRREGFSDVTEIEVPIISLDEAGREADYEATIRNVAMWIDVEGTVFDVISSGLQFLADRVALVYLEVNDLNAYEKSASSIQVISSLLEAGFIPVARDNEFHDAWNLLCVHESYFTQSRDAVFHWTASEHAQIAREKLLMD